MPTSPEDFEAMRQRTEAARQSVKPQFAGKKALDAALAVFHAKELLGDATGGLTLQGAATASSLVNAVEFLEHAKAERETGHDGLQKEIMDWCDAQWPRWVYDFPRTDLKSTLPIGRHDSTIWGPFPKCFVIETKAKGKKQSQDQLIWATRMRAIGWEVHLIYSLAEFKELTK